MSLVPSLTCSRKRRDILNGYRNTFTFVANLLVLILTMIFFATVNNSMEDFEFTKYAVMFLGIISSTFFFSSIDEVKLTKSCP